MRIKFHGLNFRLKSTTTFVGLYFCGALFFVVAPQGSFSNMLSGIIHVLPF